MTDDRIKVKDMPAGLADACRGRGHDDDDKMDPVDAIKEWSAWHLGDRWWATQIIDYYRYMKGLRGQ